MTYTNIPYDVCECTGEDAQHSSQALLLHSQDSPGWATPQHCSYPQQLTIRLHQPAKLYELQMLSHEFKIAGKVEIQVAFAPKLMKAEITDGDVPRFRRLGFTSFDCNERTRFSARELKSVSLPGVDATHVKFVFHRCHFNAMNAANQVSLIMLDVIGQTSQHSPGTAVAAESTQEEKIVNTDGRKEPHDHSCRADNPADEDEGKEVTIIRPAASIKEKASKAIVSRPAVDSVTAERILELESQKAAAVAIEDYDEAKRLKLAVERLYASGAKIAELEAKKAAAVAEEDYDMAKSLKIELERLRRRSFVSAMQAPDSSHDIDRSPASRCIKPEDGDVAFPKASLSKSAMSPTSSSNTSTIGASYPCRSPGGKDAEAKTARGFGSPAAFAPPVEHVQGKLSPDGSEARETQWGEKVRKDEEGVQVDGNEGSQRSPTEDAALSAARLKQPGRAPPTLEQNRALAGNQGQDASSHVYDDAKDEPSEQHLALNKQPTGASVENENVAPKADLDGIAAALSAEVDIDNVGPAPDGFPKDLPPPDPLSPGAKKEASGLCQLVGEYVTRCRFSASWRLREAALNYMASQVIDPEALQALDGDNNNLKTLCLSVYTGLKDRLPGVMIAAMGTLRAVCEAAPSRRFSSREIHGAVCDLVVLVAEKAADASPRIRDQAIDCLSHLARLKHVGLKSMAPIFLRPIKKGELAKCTIGRVELVSALLPGIGISLAEEGGSSQASSHRASMLRSPPMEAASPSNSFAGFSPEAMMKFLAPALTSANADLRSSASNLVVSLGRDHGVRTALLFVLLPQDINPKLKELLASKLKNREAFVGSKVPGVQSIVENKTDMPLPPSKAIASTGKRRTSNDGGGVVMSVPRKSSMVSNRVDEGHRQEERRQSRLRRDVSSKSGMHDDLVPFVEGSFEAARRTSASAAEHHSRVGAQDAAASAIVDIEGGHANILNYPTKGQSAACNRPTDLEALRIDGSMRHYVGGDPGGGDTIEAEGNVMIAAADVLHKRGGQQKSMHSAPSQISTYEEYSLAEEDPLIFEAEFRAREAELGPVHPSVAEAAANLAIIYSHKGEPAKALPLYYRALQIYEKCYGSNHAEVAHCLTDIAVILLEGGRDAEGKKMLRRAYEIQVGQLGEEHPDVVAIADVLAEDC